MTASPDSPLDAGRLGCYTSGLEQCKSCPLALAQMLITYQMVTAVDTVQI